MSAKLSNQQIKLITETATQEAIKAYEKKVKQSKKEIKDRNLRNTGLLLKNYTKLKDLCEGIDQELDEYKNTILDLEELTLESLEKYRFKTAKMMNHLDKMLIAYEWDCGHGLPEEQRRFKILKLRYLTEDKLTVKEIVEIHAIDQSTVYRDTKQAIKDISILLFGIDAVDFV